MGRRTPLGVLVLAALLVPVIAVACKKTTVTTTGTTAAAMSCKAVRSAAFAAVAVAENDANATPCAADSDCVEASSCVGQCSGHAVPKTAASSFAAAVRKVEGDECRRWKDGNCLVIAPEAIASCASWVLRCVDHRCSMVVAPQRP